MTCECQPYSSNSIIGVAEAAPPLLFETMVFGGPYDQEYERSSTWEEAETDHRLMVERCRKEVGS